MRKNKVDIITLGCSKNLVDSEQLMRQFVANGYTVEHDPHKINGEIVVVNTCGFIGDAQEESINMILELGEQKQKGRIGKLFVMGCLSERFLKDLEKELPEVDRFYGKFNWKELISDLGKSYHQELATERVLTTPRHYAYVKIGETVRTSDGRMKCCKRDGRNSLTMSHPRGYYMEYSEDNQEG